MRWIISIILFIGVLLLFLVSKFWYQGYDGAKSAHFDGSRFYNIKPVEKKTFMDVLKWRINREDPKWPKHVVYPTYPLPKENIDNDQFSLTFINHASFLLQGDHVNILTDPIWSKYASPFQWMGPKRIYAPGLSLEKLPHIDAVLISHNHYDHLDIATCLKLQAMNPKIIFIVGLGVEHYLKAKGIKHIVSLDWWQEYRLRGLLISFVPAQHFSGRGFNDHMKTLWGGFVIHYTNHPVYFAGDTADGPHFNLIKKRMGRIAVALLPIGAFEPRQFMQSSHVNPKEAVKAMQTLKASYAIGTHFDTFNGLSDEPFGHAEKYIHAAMELAKLPESRFKVLQPGQSCLYSNELLCNKPLTEKNM